jgi:hypothetical protein
MPTKADTERVGAPPQQFEMAAWAIRVPAAQMALFKAIVESYDNLATLRTEDSANERLRLYFSPEMGADVAALLSSLAPHISIRCISRS